MSKKIKSINVDDNSYDSLVSLFKQYKSSESMSSFLDRCIKDLEGYLREMENSLKEEDHFVEIMKNVIDKTIKGFGLYKPSAQYHDNEGLRDIGGPPDIEPMIEVTGNDDEVFSSLHSNVFDDSLQKEIEERHKANEIQFWKDDFEAEQKRIPRSFVKFLNSGEFVLSRDKRFLIEKETGERYMDFFGYRIVKVGKNVMIK